jgi:hypothetical protein
VPEAPVDKRLRLSGRMIKVGSAKPAVVQSGVESSITNGLQLSNLPKRRFQYTIRQFVNNS